VFKALKENLALLVIIALLGAGVYIWYLSNEIDAVQKDLDSKNLIIKNAQIEADKKAKSNQVTETIQSDVSAKEKIVEGKIDKIVERARQDVADIKKEHSSSPTTPPTQSEINRKTDAVSARRVDALWESYCEIGKTDPQCPKK
jgi:GTPase involved in cell partitioning and DNA repair